MIFRPPAILLLICFSLFFSCNSEKKETVGNVETPAEATESEPEPEESYWGNGIEILTDSLEITDWKKYEYNRSDSLIQRFIKEERNNYHLFKDRKDEYTYKVIQDLPNYLYSVRVNNDTLPDIIYQGPTDGEPHVFRIYLNRLDSFQLAFEEIQYCKKIKLENGLIRGFTIGNPGCCAEIAHYDQEFELTHTGQDVKFRQIRKIGRDQTTEKPTSFLPKPKTFKLPDNVVFLRASHAEIDGPYNGAIEQQGNIIASYSGNIPGKILASQKDKHGFVWHYVELPFRKIQPDSSIFYFEKINSPTYIQGWLPAKDLIPKN